MKSVIAIMLLMFAMNVQAQNWIDFEDKTYVGGYYFVVCQACLDGSYNNDAGVWACTDSQQAYTKGCAKGILDAILAKADE